MKRLLLSLLFVNYASCQHQPTAVPTESLPAVSNTPSSTNLPNDSSTSKAADEIPTTTFSYITPIDEQYDGFGFDNPSKSNGRMITVRIFLKYIFINISRNLICILFLF